MAQFDVHPNPVTAARGAYPWVVVLQSALANASRDRIVAPLVPRASYPPMTGRLTPAVQIAGVEYVLIVPSLAGVAARDLGEPIGSLSASRIEILSAIDFLFFGI
jgi:toxin CcdB